MTPARWEWVDDSALIADGVMVEDEEDEGSGERVVGVVVVRIEDGDVKEVEGSADAEVGVAIVENVMTGPKVVCRVVGGPDNDGSGVDNPP